MNASEAAAALGRIRTEKKSASSAATALKMRERLQDPDVQAEANRKRSEKQKARWAAVRRRKRAAWKEAGKMSSEVETLRARVAHLEQERVAFAASVGDQAHTIAAICALGNADRAGVAALALCTQATQHKASVQMQQEVAEPDRYDLAALCVNAGVGTDSETPARSWE